MRRLLISAMALSMIVPAAIAADWFAYIGTYSQGKSKGIYAYRFNPATGATTEIGLVAESSNPSFVAIHPNQQFLYAVNEDANYEGKSAGAISAYAIDRATGKLKHLNTVSSKGAAPCHLTLDKKGKWLIAANYTGGSTIVVPVKADGSLGESTAFVQHTGTVHLAQRQGGPHAHWAGMTPDNKLVMIADLGLDKILIYRLDPVKGTLTPHNPPYAATPPGSGPRHATFRPDSKFFYVLSEIEPGVVAYRFNAAKGSLDQVQTISSLPAGGFTGEKSGAEIVAHPNGKFLYSSNRGPDTIAMFRIDPKDGKLTAGGQTPTGGKTPRNFAIDPTGTWLWAANQGSQNIALFQIDQTTGALTPSGKVLEVGTPVCVVFTPAK